MPLSPQVQQAWPTVHQYDEALLNASSAVYDSDIKHGRLHQDSTGPFHFNDVRAGTRYVCVYRVDAWIVRCLTGNPPPNLRERYQAISSYHAKYMQQLSFFVPHLWVEPAIKIEGKDWPFIKASYVAHASLGTFLEEHHMERQLVSTLADQFLHMVETMESLQVAHGDLDVSNILVCGTPPDITLCMIDFDSMFVPTLRGIVKEGRPWEAGHEHFQPVQPDVRKFDREMDRFSALVIYLSLIALVEDGRLWETCKANEENKLLLGSHDFRQLGISSACQELRARYHLETLQKCLDELAASLEESRMPRSLSEIIHTPRQQRGKSVPGYMPLDLPLPLDHVASVSLAAPSFSPAPEPEPRRIPSAELPIPVAYIQGQETRAQVQQAPSNKKSSAAVGWLSIALLATIVLAVLFTMQAPGLWVIPAIIGLVLIVVWRNSQST
jgi:hypothetical protein